MDACMFPILLRSLPAFRYIELILAKLAQADSNKDVSTRDPWPVMDLWYRAACMPLHACSAVKISMIATPVF